MALIYATIGFGAGVLLAAGTQQLGRLGCGVGQGWWWLPLLGAAGVGWFWRHPPRATGPLRWPVSAGFRAPASGPPPGLWPAVALCLVAGFLRMGETPPTGCVRAGELAAWNLPGDRAFDRAAPQVTLTGTVVNFPVIRHERQAVTLAVTHLTTADGDAHPVTGRAQFNAPLQPRLRYGDPISVQGRLVMPPVFTQFSYRDYLARQGIYSMVQAAQVTRLDAPRGGPWWRQRLADLRARGLALLEQNLPEPHAALAAGILLGIHAGIPDDLQERFNAAGAGHVLVISGSNVALIAAALMLVARRVVGRWAAGPVIAGIVLYALLVGGDAPVWRAALMGCLVVFAGPVARRSRALVSLAAAAWLMMLINPTVLWDVGFQLSAAATAGLVLYMPGLQQWTAARWAAIPHGILLNDRPARAAALLGGLVVESGLMTIAASVLVMPLIAWHFGRAGLVGLAVNLLIVPVQPLILLAGTLGLITGVAGLPWLPQVALWVAWLGLAWTERVVSLAAELPWADVAVDGYGLPALLATYAAIAGLHLGSRRTNAARPVPHQAAQSAPGQLRVPMALAVVALLVWVAVAALPDGKLHVHFLDVGQGDAIFIRTPDGRQVLIDGGPDGQALFNQLGQVMPFWDRSLDLVIATHPDSDHIGGLLRLPERLRIAAAVDTPQGWANPAGANWRVALDAAGIPVTLQSQGGQIDLGRGAVLEVLWPPARSPVDPTDANENSLVLRLVYGEFRVLLTGDAGLLSEGLMLAQGLPLAATVLKVGHHGSAGSTDARLVDAVDPQIAVISVGAGNRYGHPAEVVLANLAGRALYRTDRHGRIHLRSDGARVWVTTARQ